MKIYLIFILSFLLFAVNSNAQKIYAVEYANLADVKVFVVNYQSQADLLVYKVDYASQAGKNDGNWFYVKYKSQADKKERIKIKYIFIII